MPAAASAKNPRRSVRAGAAGSRNPVSSAALSAKLAALIANAGPAPSAA